ncbi:hypothetical protein NQ318_013148 [Aromia moschata]|uniref:THAP-type domain-containing protein n=1 Tax=Aromia moschata TaxID=1265417 RepID=A0AAV8Y2G2_9CUCU|nr:hypothetical protein NQ318_013148 [Aromia moschata]
MPQCAVAGCNSTHRKTKGGSIRYHRFPGDSKTRARWLQACGKQLNNCSTARICSRHFAEESYERDVQHEILGLPTRCRLKKGAVPDRNLPTDFLKEEEVQGERHRHPVGGRPGAHRTPHGEDIGRSSAGTVCVAPLNCNPGYATAAARRRATLFHVATGERIPACISLCTRRPGVGVSQPRVQSVPAAAAASAPSARALHLNKMQIMEDVREGCNVQPSSPGHAEQRADEAEPEVKVEKNSENGYPEQNSNNEANAEAAAEQKEDAKPSEGESEPAETIKTEFPDASNLNEESYSNASSQSTESTKRKSDSEDFPVKRLRTEIQENFLSRDKILTEFIEMAECNNLEQIHTFSEQLLAEIKTLNELAKEKEREWNNIIHLKKIKEELLLRMQRKRQVMVISEKSDYLDMLGESQGENSTTEEHPKSGSPHSILKSNLTNPQKPSLRIPNINLNGDKSKHRSILPKYTQNILDFNGSLDLRQGKQRPTLDVQSIIADYRQRHPEAVPRRGGGSGILRQTVRVRQNIQGLDMSSELGILLSSMNGNRRFKPNNTDATSSLMQDNTSFRDMLLQFVRLSQSERNELIQNAIKPPPPYPEVTVHPVPTTTAAPTNSLLHGILTKSPPKQNTKTSFSPTLARLLTAPERAAARNEITITPVGSQYETTPVKTRATEEEEAEDSADRLVIDEGSEAAEARRAAADNNSDTGDEVPPCQGCNQKPAQFVCAGCGNQWYCSRDCQVR